LAQGGARMGCASSRTPRQEAIRRLRTEKKNAMLLPGHGSSAPRYRSPGGSKQGRVVPCKDDDYAASLESTDEGEESASISRSCSSASSSTHGGASCQTANVQLKVMPPAKERISWSVAP